MDGLRFPDLWFSSCNDSKHWTPKNFLPYLSKYHFVSQRYRVEFTSFIERRLEWGFSDHRICLNLLATLCTGPFLQTLWPNTAGLMIEWHRRHNYSNAFSVKAVFTVLSWLKLILSDHSECNLMTSLRGEHSIVLLSDVLYCAIAVLHKTANYTLTSNYRVVF